MELTPTNKELEIRIVILEKQVGLLAERLSLQMELNRQMIELLKSLPKMAKKN